MNSKTKSVIAAALLAAFLTVPAVAMERTRGGDQTGGSFISKVIKQVRRLLSASFDDVGGPKP